MKTHKQKKPAARQHGRARDNNCESPNTSYHEQNGNQVSRESRSPERPKTPVYNNTDAGNAKRFVDQHCQDVRYCYATGKWLIWDGRRWRDDTAGEVMERAKETARSIYREAEAPASRAEREGLAKWAVRSEGRDRLKAMIELVKSEQRIRVDASDLDANPWLFNCENGTVDLKTGRIREHRKEDYLTKLCQHSYDENASCPAL